MLPFTQNAALPEQAQLSYIKAYHGGGRAAVQEELCRHSRGPRDSSPLHWDLEPQRKREVSTEDKGSIEERQQEMEGTGSVNEMSERVGKAVKCDGQ